MSVIESLITAALMKMQQEYLMMNTYANFVAYKQMAWRKRIRNKKRTARLANTKSYHKS